MGGGWCWTCKLKREGPLHDLAEGICEGEGKEEGKRTPTDTEGRGRGQRGVSVLWEGKKAGSSASNNASVLEKKGETNKKFI